MTNPQCSMRHCIMKGYNDTFLDKANMFAEHLGDGDVINDSYMHDAARFNNIFALQVLLDKGYIDRCRQNMSGNTPLHTAAYQGNCESIELLLKNKADPNIGNEKNELPLHRAVSNGKLEAVKLLAPISTIDHPAQDHNTVLHLAARTGNLEVMKILLLHGATLAAPNARNRSVLHCAAISGDLPTIAYLITSGVSVTAVDSNSRTPSQIAFKPDAIEFLKKCENVANDTHALKCLCDDVMVES